MQGACGGRMKSAGRDQTCRVNHPGWKRLTRPPVAENRLGRNRDLKWVVNIHHIYCLYF